MLRQAKIKIDIKKATKEVTKKTHRHEKGITAVITLILSILFSAMFIAESKAADFKTAEKLFDEKEQVMMTDSSLTLSNREMIRKSVDFSLDLEIKEALNKAQSALYVPEYIRPLFIPDFKKSAEPQPRYLKTKQ